MRSVSIWTIACAAALTLACGDSANRNNHTAAGTDRTSAPARSNGCSLRDHLIKYTFQGA